MSDAEEHNDGPSDEPSEIAPLHPAGSEGGQHAFSAPGAPIEDAGVVLLAPYGARVGGYLIDGLLVGLLVRGASGGLGLSPYAGSLLTLFIEGLYATVLIAYFHGQTLGMRFLGLRCVQTDRRGRVPLGQAFARAFSAVLIAAGSVVAAGRPIGVLLLLGPALDLLWPAWDFEKQTLHDKIAKTVVVR